ncbi:MAG: Ig-like domain-containing protein, partial [Haloferula sp.]
LNGAYQGDQVVSLGGAAARYVGIEMMSNNGDANRVGFAEVAITSGTAGPDTEAPVISSLGPEDDATDVAVSANLVATFDEEIAAATGLITIKNLTDATEGTIDITDGTQVSISGAVLTIDPAFDLEEDKDYAIQIASAAIEDTSGNDFGGIEDDVTWSFTTESSLIQIGPGADLAGASSSDGAGGERLNIALSSPAGDDFVTLPAGTYTVVDFQLSVDDHNAGIDGAGTVAPMLLTGSSGSWTTLWVGGDVDPTSNGVQTAASYPPDGETFTLSETADVYAGIFTKNQGSAIPSTNLSVGRTDHDSSFVAPSGPGETVNGISNPNLQRAYAFEVNVVPGGTPANSFANYISDPAFGLAPEEQGLDDDPDGDGIGNGVENFFGTNPGAFSQGLVAGAANQGEGTFTFSHPLNDSPADDLTAVYRWSKDLASFTADGTPFEGTTVTFTPGVPAGGMVTVTATVTGIGVDRLFVDVEVTP